MRAKLVGNGRDHRGGALMTRSTRRGVKTWTNPMAIVAIKTLALRGRNTRAQTKTMPMAIV
eukprot:10049950-Lingulodinium_polyedra.AAC.1